MGRLFAIGLGIAALAALPTGAAGAAEVPVRCHDLHGQPWNFYELNNGQPYVVKTSTRYFVYASSERECAFARQWGRKLSLGRRNVTNTGRFTDAPRGYRCKQMHSDVYRNEAKRRPPTGFDVGLAYCTRTVGKRPHRRSLGFSWRPLPLSIDPY